ncbi:MAG: hypothetical protein EAX96_05870 [Candidatus Lokiarchaeota archaeon]|nr:hypothetical protein [Candidatus Lokiarchaeota archaeon]
MLYLEIKGLGHQWKEFTQTLQLGLRRYNFELGSKFNPKVNHNCDRILIKKTSMGKFEVGSKSKMKMKKLELNIQACQKNQDIIVNIVSKKPSDLIPGEIQHIINTVVEEAKKKIQPESLPSVIVQLEGGTVSSTQAGTVNVFECPKCHAPLPRMESGDTIDFCPYCDAALYVA